MFSPGDKVICINDKEQWGDPSFHPYPWPFPFVKKGEIYCVEICQSAFLYKDYLFDWGIIPVGFPKIQHESGYLYFRGGLRFRKLERKEDKVSKKEINFLSIGIN